MQGQLLQAGQRFQAITLLGTGSVELTQAGFIPSSRLGESDNALGGAFACSDPDLDKVWQIGVHTANTCSVPVRTTASLGPTATA